MPFKLDRARAEDLGKAVLRITIGGEMLLHGLSKLEHGVGGIGTRLAEVGVPAFVSYGVYLGEVVAPLLLLVGYATRLAALMVAATMLVAVALVHSADVFVLTERGGAWGVELQGLYFFGSLAIALLGPGRYAVGRTRFD